MTEPFTPPRGGAGSQAEAETPVPSAFWQPPEAVKASKFWPYKRGGLLLGWVDDVPIGVQDDRHLVTVAGARAGKTSTLLIPNLRLYEGAAVVLDPKGELATATAQDRADRLGHTVHVLDPWGVAAVPDKLRAKFNPLAELGAGDGRDLIDDAALMAEALIQDQGENSAHWVGSAREFVRAVTRGDGIVGVDHVRASAALLPAFPPVEIARREAASGEGSLAV